MRGKRPLPPEAFLNRKGFGTQCPATYQDGASRIVQESTNKLQLGVLVYMRRREQTLTDGLLDERLPSDSSERADESTLQ